MGVEEKGDFNLWHAHKLHLIIFFNLGGNIFQNVIKDMKHLKLLIC